MSSIFLDTTKYFLMGVGVCVVGSLRRGRTGACAGSGVTVTVVVVGQEMAGVIRAMARPASLGRWASLLPMDISLWLDDDRRLALCWDKVGLGHNGERLPDGGHTVLFGVASK